MKIALHTVTTMHSNCLTDVRIAHELGYDGLEIIAPKLKRFLSNGHDISELAATCQRAEIPVTCINALADSAAGKPKTRDELLAECEMLSTAAEALACPTIQLVFFNIPAGGDWPTIRQDVAALAGELADIGATNSIRFQLEPIAWTPFRTLSQSLEVIDVAARENLGTVVDFWHLWAGGDTRPDEVARMDAAQIYGIHICDGKRPAPGEEWIETKLRSYLLGEGDVPVADWVAAVKATGYEGVWSPETLSPPHWELDLFAAARDAKTRIEKYLYT